MELGDNLFVLITYDVNTETEAGKKRLRHVAKQCQNYGQRVQNSVFECIINRSQLCQLQDRIIKIIDPEVDSVRYYFFEDNYQNHVQHIGAKKSLDLEGTLIA